MGEEHKKKGAAKKAVEVPSTDMSQVENKASKRFIFWMIAVMVLAVLAGGALIYWMVGQYVTQSNKNKAQDLEIAALQTKQENLEKLKPNYEKIIAEGANGVSDADLILRALPITKGYDDLVAMLEKMAQESGVKVTSVSQTGTSSDTGEGGSSTTPIPYTFTVTLEGGYTGILDFLQKTEKSARVMNFSSMNLTGSSTGGSNQADITMQTYFQLPANISSTTEPLQ
jgi:Tfp pilus assembly protein PilO